MKVYVKLKDEEYNAYFTSTVHKGSEDYGNGIYLDIKRNDKNFKYLDCRYIADFDEEKVLTNFLQNYFGENLVSIETIKETNETYYVSNDRQGGGFGMCRNYTLDEWREQAIDWADMDENDDLIAILETIKDEKLLDFISEIWDLEFAKGCWQGIPINNEHGIEMYYNIADDRLNILDSNGKYYDYLSFVDIEDTPDNIMQLEDITIHALCYSMLFNHKLYNSLEELQLDQQDPEITESNDYVNVFIVNDKKYYIWSE